MFPINIDRIFIKNKDYHCLFEWWNNIHEGDVVSFSPVLEEGLIYLALSPRLDKDEEYDNYSQFIHFKHLDDKSVIYNIYRLVNSKHVLLMTVRRDYELFKFVCDYWNSNILSFPPDQVSSYVDSVTNVHPAIMNYMEFYKDERERVSATKERVVRTKKTTNKKNKKSVKPITRYSYTISPSTNTVSDTDKRNYRKMTESWLVRGHWRTNKNGNKIWIKPYVKGNNESREFNDYEF